MARSLNLGIFRTVEQVLPRHGIINSVLCTAGYCWPQHISHFNLFLTEIFFPLVLDVRGRDPFNQNSSWSNREKWSTSKGGPVFSKLFWLDRTDPLSFGPKFPEILVEWIAPRDFRFRSSLNVNHRRTQSPAREKKTSVLLIRGTQRLSSV